MKNGEISQTKLTNINVNQGELTYEDKLPDNSQGFRNVDLDPILIGVGICGFGLLLFLIGGVGSFFMLKKKNS
jgi:hypothetical protein